MGTSFAIKADQSGLLAPYKVATWTDIPANSRASDATWYDDYGGYVAIGYDSAKVKVPPTSFKDLLKPIYKNQVAINGNPTQASAAFSAVYTPPWPTAARWPTSSLASSTSRSCTNQRTAVRRRGYPLPHRLTQPAQSSRAR